MLHQLFDWIAIKSSMSSLEVRTNNAIVAFTPRQYELLLLWALPKLGLANLIFQELERETVKEKILVVLKEHLALVKFVYFLIWTWGRTTEVSISQLEFS